MATVFELVLVLQAYRDLKSNAPGNLFSSTEVKPRMSLSHLPLIQKPEDQKLCLISKVNICATVALEKKLISLSQTKLESVGY